jgi:hypothetical protein
MTLATEAEPSSVLEARHRPHDPPTAVLALGIRAAASAFRSRANKELAQLATLIRGMAPAYT